MFQTVGRHRDPEWALRQVLTIISLLLGLSCGCGGVVAWLGVKAFLYLLGLLLGLILPPPPPTLDRVPEVELVQIELEDPLDIQEEELEAPDYGEWLAAQEAAAAEAEAVEELLERLAEPMPEPMPELVMLSNIDAPRQMGVLAILGSSEGSSGAMADLWTDDELSGIGSIFGTTSSLEGGVEGGVISGSGGGGGLADLSLAPLASRGGGALRATANLRPLLDSMPEPPLPEEARGTGEWSCMARVQVSARGRAEGEPTWVSCPESMRSPAARALRKARWSWPAEPLPQEVRVTVWFSDPD